MVMEEMAGSNPNRSITWSELKLNPKNPIQTPLWSLAAFFALVFFIIFSGIAMVNDARFLAVFKALFHCCHRCETRIPLLSNAMARGESPESPAIPA